MVFSSDLSICNEEIVCGAANGMHLIIIVHLACRRIRKIVLNLWGVTSWKSCEAHPGQNCN